MATAQRNTSRNIRIFQCNYKQLSKLRQNVFTLFLTECESLTSWIELWKITFKHFEDAHE